MNIYLDMDGVLANFDSEIRRRRGDPDSSYIHLPKDQWTPAQHERDRVVKLEMDKPDFWPSLPIMPGAHQLYDVVKTLGNAFILTARPNETASAERCARQKREWIWKNIDPLLCNDRIIVCLRSEKQQYAAGAVLVDDMEINCEQWQAAGGKAILFKSAQQAIEELRNIVHA